MSDMQTTTQQYIELAIEARSPQDNNDMLTVKEFIEVTKFPIDKLYIDKFWASLHDNQLIYIDDELTRWMGFEAALAKHRKDTLTNLLKNNGIEYFEYDNSEYSRFLSRSAYADHGIYPPPPASRGGATNMKHMLLDADSLKMAMMIIGRGKGRYVREYYLTLEKLLKSYMQYQTRFKEIKSECNIKLLEEKSAEIEQRDRQLTVFKQELDSAKIIIAEKDKRLANTQAVNGELLSYKLFLGNSETVYIITSNAYAYQGLFKVGKTAALSAKHRLNTMNTGHAPGDDLFIAREFKVHSAKLLEDRVHDILCHFRVKDTREWFHIPFLTLCRVINLLNDNRNAELDIVNEITRILYEISCTNPDQLKYHEGVTMSICAPPSESATDQNDTINDNIASETLQPTVEEVIVDDVDQALSELAISPISQPAPASSIQTISQPAEPQTAQPPTVAEIRQPTEPEPQPQPDQIQFTFHIRDWTTAQTHNFIVNVLEEYKKEIGPKKGAWTPLSKILTQKFKPFDKKPNVNAAREQIVRLCRAKGVVLK
jgi:hypothetical protein